MTRKTASRLLVVTLGLTLTAAAGLAGACAGQGPLNPNYMPGDSLHPGGDTNPSQGMLPPPRTGAGARLLV